MTEQYFINRKFFEGLIAFASHSTRPMMDIFRADIENGLKVRVVIDYSPQENQVKFEYHKEDIQ